MVNNVDINEQVASPVKFKDQSDQDLAEVMQALSGIELQSLKLQETKGGEIRATSACKRMFRRLSNEFDLQPGEVKRGEVYPWNVTAGDVHSWRGPNTSVEIVECDLQDGSHVGNVRIARKSDDETGYSIDFTRMKGIVTIDEEEVPQDTFFVNYQIMDLKENEELAGWHDDGDISDIKIDPRAHLNKISQAGNIIPRISAQANQLVSSSFLIGPLDTYIRTLI